MSEDKTKKDACYHKVKSRYDVWPSAYASGALVKCRKVGAKNWGNKTDEEIELEEIEIVKEYSNEEETIEENFQIHEKEKETLRKWFGRKGEKGSKGGWVDCNAPDGKGGHKACADDGKRKKYGTYY